MTLDEIAQKAANKLDGLVPITDDDVMPFLQEAYEAGIRDREDEEMADALRTDPPVAPERYEFEGQWWEEDVAVPRPPIEGEVYLFCNVAKRANHNFVSCYPILRPVAPVELPPDFGKLPEPEPKPFFGDGPIDPDKVLPDDLPVAPVQHISETIQDIRKAVAPVEKAETPKRQPTLGYHDVEEFYKDEDPAPQTAEDVAQQIKATCLSLGIDVENRPHRIWWNGFDNELAAALITTFVDGKVEKEIARVNDETQAECDLFARIKEDEIDRLKDQLAALRAENVVLKASADLQLSASERACALWDKTHPAQLFMVPDKAKLMVWLMEQNSALKKEGSDVK